MEKRLAELEDELAAVKQELTGTRMQRDLYLKQRDQARLCSTQGHHAPATQSNPSDPSVAEHHQSTQRISSAACVTPTSKVQRTVSVRSPLNPEGRMYRELETCARSCGLDPAPLIRFPNDTRRFKLLDHKWLEIDIPSGTDVLILSDSVLRSVNASAISPNSAVFAFGGLFVSDLLGILFKAVSRGVKTDCLVLCAGVNDLFSECASYALDDLKHVIAVAKRVSPRIILCTAYKAGWKTKKGRGRKCLSEKAFDDGMLLYNNGVQRTAANHPEVTLFDLARIFAHHDGRTPNSPGWYLKDAVHPNINGTAAIEICLKQLLVGGKVVPPETTDERLFHHSSAQVVDQEHRRRRDLQQQNCPNLWDRGTVKKRPATGNVVVTVPCESEDGMYTVDAKRQRRM